jgi:hypothetical protein
MVNWHGLNTKPHPEFQVMSGLDPRSLPADPPSVPIPHARPGHPRQRAFFLCYLFARLDLEDVGLPSVAYLSRMRRLVRVGSEPPIVAGQDVEHGQIPVELNVEQIRKKVSRQTLARSGPQRPA